MNREAGLSFPRPLGGLTVQTLTILVQCLAKRFQCWNITRSSHLQEVFQPWIRMLISQQVCQLTYCTTSLASGIFNGGWEPFPEGYFLIFL